MGRGFLAGIFWGAVVGVALLFVSSQTLDRQQMSFPQPEASAVEVPGGSEFDQARVETDPVLPEPEAAPEAGPTRGIAIPVDEVDAPPAMDTSALEVPVPDPVQDAPAGLGDAPVEQDAPADPGVAEDTAPAGGSAGPLEAPEAPAAAPEAETAEPAAPVSEPEPELAPAPDVAAESEAPEAEAGVAALPDAPPEAPEPQTELAPEVVQQDEAPAAMMAPEISDEPSLPTADVAVAPPPGEPGLPQIVAPEVESQPEVEEAPAETEIAAVEPEPEPVPNPEPEPEPKPEPEPELAVEAATEEPRLVRPAEDLTDRDGEVEDTGLPTVLRIGEDSEEVAEEPAEEDIAADQPAVEDGPALTVYGVPFENLEGRPLLSVILVHEGGEAPDRSKIDALPANVSFAVDAGREDASRVAAAYRAAGREVVMIPSLPSGARPQDVEQALRVNFDRVPEAVALMDASGSSFQSDRNAVAQIVAVVSDSGHGLITFPRGLNTAHQEAGRAGVPAGLIFRDIDGSGETQEQVGRALDRAAFRARQDEAVILVGRTTDVTQAAIIEWSQGSRAESVTLAPVSAALGG